MTYLINIGADKPPLTCNEWQYEALVRLHGYIHELRELTVTVIKKGR